MATNPFHKSRQKFEIEDNEVFINDDSLFDPDPDLDFDLELDENTDQTDLSEQVVDDDFLSSVNQIIGGSQKLSRLMIDKSQSKEDDVHPIDAHLKKLILSVLVQDFLPILEKRFNSIKKT
jgi:hypothetical protein